MQPRWWLHFLTLQEYDQFDQAIDNRLMQQVNPQRLPSAPAEKANEEEVLRCAGEFRFSIGIDRPADGCANQKPAELREQRKVVAGGKAVIDQAERE